MSPSGKPGCTRSVRWIAVCCWLLTHARPAAAAPPLDEAPEPEASEADQAPEAEASETDQAPEPEASETDQAPEAEAAEPSSAVEWYARGIELGNAGDFDGAAQAFLRSYELQPTSEALFNAGLALQNGGDHIAAIETFRRFLAEPDRNIELARAAEDAIAKLVRKVGTLKGIRYAASRPPAELYIAGQRRELDELPLLVPPGPVEIEVVDEQGERARETYEIAPGEALVIDVRALLPAKVVPPKDEPPRIDVTPTAAEIEARRRRQLRAKQLRLATWVGLGLTGAATISYGTLTGLAARERNSFLDETCFEFGGDCPGGFVPGDPEAHLDAYARMRTGALISVGLAGGFAVGSLVVGLVSLHLERKPAKDRPRARLEPSLGGLTLRF